jgi:IclR family pca regulon transcriptional regulator
VSDHEQVPFALAKNNLVYVESLARGLSVLKAFGVQDRPLSVTEVAEVVGITRAAARRFVLTLEYLGYLSFEGDGYSLRAAVLEVGDAYLLSHRLPAVAHPHLSTLVQEVGETASLTVLHQDRVYYIGRVHADRVVTANIIVGTSVPAYATATGRVLLSGKSDAALDEYLKSLAPESFTQTTAVDRAEIRARVMQARDQGWSLADQELTPGLRSIAVPVRDKDRNIAAVLNISAHATRVTAEALRATVLPKLQKTADAVTADLMEALQQ